MALNPNSFYIVKPGAVFPPFCGFFFLLIEYTALYFLLPMELYFVLNLNEIGIYYLDTYLVQLFNLQKNPHAQIQKAQIDAK